MHSHDSAARAPMQAPDRATWLFVQAEADPGLLPRVLGALAKRSLVPDHLHVTRDPAGLSLDLRLTDLAPSTRSILAASLRQVVGVRSVLTTDG